MKILLVPTDFSKTSLNAVNYAADMAVAIKAQLLLLHVVQIEVISEPSVYPSQLEEDAFEFMKHGMQLLKIRLEKRTKNQVPVITKIEEGNVNIAIKEMNDSNKPFAIILGSKGATDFENFMLGSVALHNAKHSSYPVLLIPEKAKFKSISNIAFASDLYLKNAAPVIKVLREWLKMFRAKLNVVNINDRLDFESEKTKDFNTLKNRLKNYDAYFNYIVNDSVTEGILKYLKKNKPDIIVLMYHKEAFLHRFIYRSDFKKIIVHSATPVLIIPNNN